MNATRWVSLSEFVKHLGRSGIAKVEDSELGWFISWIDNSSSARAKQDALQKMERMKTDDEQRTRKLLEEQIRRAHDQNSSLGLKEDDTKLQERREEGITRENAQAPVKLAFSATKPVGGAVAPAPAPALEREHATGESGAGASKEEPKAPAPGIFKMRMNPLKSANAAPKDTLGSALKTNTSSDGAATKRKPPPTHLGAAERIIMEEQRKRTAHGPQMQAGVKRSRF